MKIKITKQKIILLTLILISLIILIFAITFALDQNYKNKFYPGIKINKVGVSGLNYLQAKKIFEAKLDSFNREGQTFVYKNKSTQIYPVVISEKDPDLSREIISFDLNKTLNSAYNLGREKNFFNSIWQKIKLIFINKKFSLEFELNTQEVNKILKNNFQELEEPGNNPELKFNNNNFEIINAKTGLIFDYNSAINNFQNNLKQLDFKLINLKLKLSHPEFSKNDILPLMREVEKIVKIKNLKLYTTSTSEFEFPEKQFFISQDLIKDWLNFGWDDEKQKAKLIFKQEKVEKYLNEIKWQIEKPIKEAKFKLINNLVSEFQNSQAGFKIDFKKTLENLEQEIIFNKKNTAQISIQKLEPQTNIANINDLGIKELIGVGVSNFSGSPVNRRHNIKIGAQSLNGLLINPNDEFSTNKSLGEINAKKGYLPELVIKGNETIAEYGGGLCQIATTLFRLAINSGLEITARKPHAYRVGYYEPAGTDATIYSPWPDFRFINNTSNYLLLQTRIQDNDLIFEFWGTSDNREVATTTPKIWNFTSPAETKYIETTDLEPKKVKCIETAHYGAEAEFTRTINYPNSDQEPKIENWYSSYRPWQAVCLIGVDPNKSTTSTEEIIE